MLKKLKFTGKVLPVHTKVNLQGLPQIKWEDGHISSPIFVTLQIANNQLTIDCEADTSLRTDEIHVRVTDIAKSAVNLLAYHTGIALSVILETITHESGVTEPMMAADPSLSALCTALDLQKDFTNALLSTFKDPAVFMALDDLIVAIGVFHAAPVNCARAVEGIRYAISPQETEVKKAWENMRTVLNVDTAYLKLITDNSLDHRHGKRTHVPGDIAREIVRRSWTIMNRYFEYQKTEPAPLPVATFPLLRG